MQTERSDRWRNCTATAARRLGRLVALLTLPALIQFAAPSYGRTAEAADSPARAAKIYLQGSFQPKAGPFLRKVILAVDAETGDWQMITPGYDPRVSPDGARLLYSAAGDLWCRDTREALDPKRIAERYGRTAWLPDSQRIVLSLGKYDGAGALQSESWQMRADGTNQQPFPVPSTDMIEDISADGKWIVTSSDRFPPHGRAFQLYAMRPDGTGETRLTRGGLNGYPRIAPDGRRVIYKCQDRDGSSLKLVNIDGTGEQTLLTAVGETDAFISAAWSPDGRELVVARRLVSSTPDGAPDKPRPQSQRSEEYQIEILAVDGPTRRSLQLKNAQIHVMGTLDWR